MTIPAKWAKGRDWQRIVSSEVNPILQGALWPQYASAPSPAQNEGYGYYDTTKHAPAWFDGTQYQYFIGDGGSGDVAFGGNVTVGGTLGVTGATTLTALTATGNATVGGTLGVTGTTTVNALTIGGLTSAQGILAAGVVLSSSQIGYQSGAGGTVTQTTSRTTAVSLNKICGAITLVSAAASTTFASFTVNNTTVGSADGVIVWQKSGTLKYRVHVTNVVNNSFEITFASTTGTTTEQPVFGFAVIKAVTT